MWIEARDKRTNRLLFKYEPLSEQVEIAHRDGKTIVDLQAIKKKNAKRIQQEMHALRGMTPDPETA